MIQQGRPFSFVFKFVMIEYNCSLELSPTNQIVYANVSLLICRYLKARLDVYWSTVTVDKIKRPPLQNSLSKPFSKGLH